MRELSFLLALNNGRAFLIGTKHEYMNKNIFTSIEKIWHPKNRQRLERSFPGSIILSYEGKLKQDMAITHPTRRLTHNVRKMSKQGGILNNEPLEVPGREDRALNCFTSL